MKNPRHAKETADFAARLTKKWKDSGVSHGQLHRQLLPTLLDHVPTEETLRGYHNGTLHPSKISPALLAGFAEVYGCDVADFGPVAEEYYQRSRDLLIQRSSCNGEPAAQMRLALAS